MTETRVYRLTLRNVAPFPEQDLLRLLDPLRAGEVVLEVLDEPGPEPPMSIRQRLHNAAEQARREIAAQPEWMRTPPSEPHGERFRPKFSGSTWRNGDD